MSMTNLFLDYGEKTMGKGAQEGKFVDDCNHSSSHAGRTNNEELSSAIRFGEFTLAKKLLTSPRGSI